MKHILIIFILFFGLITNTNTQNFINAGQTVGANIYYTDYEPDFTAIYPGINEFQLDIDNNGSDDLLFSVHYHNNCDEYITWWTSVEIVSENVHIISQGNPESGYVRQLLAGDTISSHDFWNSDSISSLTFQYFFKVISTGQQIHHGEFSDGYLGYKMIHQTDTLYGWISIHATYETIIAMENSILDRTYGTNEYSKSNNPYQLYPNPCRKQLTVCNYSAKNTNTRFEIFTIYGNRVKSGNILNPVSEINITELIPGVYFMEVIEEEQTMKVFKFIKHH